MPNCTVLVCAAHSGRAPRVAHSFDTDGGVDVTLRFVPRSTTFRRLRPVHAWDENAVPRYTETVLGHVDLGDILIHHIHPDIHTDRSSTTSSTSSNSSNSNGNTGSNIETSANFNANSGTDTTPTLSLIHISEPTRPY